MDSNYNAGGVVDLAFENVLTGDLNGDTSGDLFVIRPDGELLWLKTDAFNLNIQSQDQITAGAGLGTSLTSVDAGDFDGDGNIDIIVGRSTAGGTSGNVGWYEVLETSPDIFEIVLQQEMFNLGAAVLDLQIIAPEASAFVDSADFDVDLDVDGEDFLTWQRGFGAAGGLAQGDANDSGFVDAADLAIWEAQYGIPILSAATAAVPEPGSAMLLLSGMIAAVFLRRRS